MRSTAQWKTASSATWALAGFFRPGDRSVTNQRNAKVEVNGVFTNDLTDEFQTYSVPLGGEGDVLTLILRSGSNNNSGRCWGMDNLKLHGTRPSSGTVVVIRKRRRLHYSPATSGRLTG